METIIDGIVYEFQPWGGISRLYNEILPRMCDIDDSLRITLMIAGHGKQPLPTHERIQYRWLLPIHRILRPYRMWWRTYPSMRKLMQRIAFREQRDGIWHSTYYTMPHQWTGPVVCTVFDMIHERFSLDFSTAQDNMLREHKRQCIAAADSIVCISLTTLEDLQQFYGMPKATTQVVPLACSETFRPLGHGDFAASTLPDEPFLLYVGDRDSRYKNFRVLLETYCRWSENHRIGLVIVGKPWSDAEMLALEELGTLDRVHLSSGVSDERLCQLYNQASAFIYPSLYEGFGIPLLEAMACGCPIIASQIPSTTEVAGECPIYFDPTEPEDLLRALNIALEEGRDSVRVQQGLGRVKRFSWEETARRTLEVYRALSNLD